MRQKDCNSEIIKPFQLQMASSNSHFGGREEFNRTNEYKRILEQGRGTHPVGSGVVPKKRRQLNQVNQEPPSFEEMKGNGPPYMSHRKDPNSPKEHNAKKGHHNRVTKDDSNNTTIEDPNLEAENSASDRRRRRERN